MVSRKEELLKLGVESDLLEAAQWFLDEALKIDPNYKEAWYEKGHVYILFAMGQKAVKCFERALGLPPKSVELDKLIWYWYGHAFRMMNRLEDTVRCWEEAIKLDPTWLKPHYERTIALHSLGREEEALDSIEFVLLDDPSDKLMLYYKGVSFAKSEKYKEAIEILEQAIRSDTRNYSKEFLEGEIKNLREESTKKWHIQQIKQLQDEIARLEAQKGINRGFLDELREDLEGLMNDLKDEIKDSLKKDGLDLRFLSILLASVGVIFAPMLINLITGIDEWFFINIFISLGGLIGCALIIVLYIRKKKKK